MVGESLEQLRAPGEGRLWGTPMRGAVSFLGKGFPRSKPQQCSVCGKASPFWKALAGPGWRGHLKSLWCQLQFDGPQEEAGHRAAL